MLFTLTKVLQRGTPLLSVMKSVARLIVTAWITAIPVFAEKPVKVYILSGQSNMVGIGQVSGGGIRWGAEMTNPVLSVYEGKVDPAADYDSLKPVSNHKLESFGGTNPTPYAGGGARVVRGSLQMKETGVYEFRPGYGDSEHCIMTVDGVEVHRKLPGQDAVRKPLKIEAGNKAPFKIIYLTAGANGLGWTARMDIPGTLSTVVRQEGKFPHLINKNGNWVQRDDVRYKGLITATANQPLGPGCGAGANNIGPELGFGNVIGDFHDEPVLLLKSSQGNRSLAWDFLPPGSERFEHGGRIYAGYKDSPDSWEKGTEPKPVNWYAGKQYDDCFQAVHKVLENFGTEFPQWKDLGYEIAGFVWWQGHKDTGSEVTAGRYEQNLVHLIKTLRAEFKAPAAPFVVATIGFDGWKMEGNTLTVAKAQLAVSGDTGKYPEFKGNVKTVETRDFWRDASISPKNQGFHYNQNAETYMLVGEAIGRGMIELIGKH